MNAFCYVRRSDTDVKCKHVRTALQAGLAGTADVRTHGSVGWATASVDPVTPITSEDDVTGRRECRIIVDGQIHNESSVRPKLEEPGPTPTDLVRAAYRRWGPEFPTHLVGSFVYLIDDYDADRLFAGRDKTGLRKVFYYNDKSITVVGSEPSVVLAHPAVERRINRPLLAEFVRGEIATRRETFFRGVEVPDRGEYVDLSNDRIVRYWTPTDHEISQDKPLPDALRSRIEKAIDSRTDRSLSHGVAMSGGLDSTAVASVLIGSTTADDIGTYSIVFDDIDESGLTEGERERIERMYDVFGITGTELVADDVYFDLSSYSSPPDIPWTSVVGCPRQELYEMAADDGVDTMFKGQGGNLYNGFSSYYLDRLRRDGILSTLSRIRSDPNSTHSIFFSTVQKYAALRQFQRLHAAFELFNPHVVDVVTDTMKPRISAPTVTIPPDVPAPDSFELREIYGLYWDRLVEFQRLRARRAAVRAGVSPQYPLWDSRVVELLFSTPPGSRYCNGLDKSLFREAMDGVQPDSIRTNTSKETFDPFMTRTLNENESTIRQSLTGDTLLAALEIVKQHRVATLVDRVLANSHPGQMAVWRLYTAEKFLQTNRGAIDDT